MDMLRVTYGLRRVSLVAVCVLLPASTIHVLNLPSEQSVTHLNQGLQDFQSMSLNHPFAGRCVEIIRAFADKWNIPLPECTVAARSTGPRQMSSDPSQTFRAASTPRTGSSDSGTRSDGSISALRESSSQPPPCALEQQPASSSSMCTDPTVSLYSDQPHAASCTTFPAQTMPVSPQNFFPSMPIEVVQQMMGEVPQWSMYGNSGAYPTSNVNSTQRFHAEPACMDEMASF